MSAPPTRRRHAAAAEERAQARLAGARLRAAAVLFALGAGLAPGPAAAALSKADLDRVVAAPDATSAIPLDATLTDADGRPVRLDSLVGPRPSLLILADYRCTQLCGSILGIAAQALRGSGLRPDAEFNLIVVGFNPEATGRDGARMQRDQMGLYPELRAAAHILTGSPQTIDRIARAVGFTVVRDAAAGRYAHPAEVFVLTSEGRPSRVLNALSLDPSTVRLALVEAGQGRIGTLVDRLHVLCYGLDPLSGASTGLAQTLLKVGASLTMAAAGLLIVLANRRRGVHPPGGA